MSKHYWICIYCPQPRQGVAIWEEHLITEHPFKWLYQYNHGDPESLHDACRDQYILINWKEISEEEYNLYQDTNFPAAGDGTHPNQWGPWM